VSPADAQRVRAVEVAELRGLSIDGVLGLGGEQGAPSVFRRRETR
jgi:hypothetical protein